MRSSQRELDPGGFDSRPYRYRYVDQQQEADKVGLS